MRENLVLDKVKVSSYNSKLFPLLPLTGGPGKLITQTDSE